MNRYFSSFHKSRGGGTIPQKNSRGGGGTRRPRPPGIAAYGERWHIATSKKVQNLDYSVIDHSSRAVSLIQAHLGN